MVNTETHVSRSKYLFLDSNLLIDPAQPRGKKKQKKNETLQRDTLQTNTQRLTSRKQNYIRSSQSKFILFLPNIVMRARNQSKNC